MPKAIKDKEKIRSANLFPVVGIGASAGGLDAFKRLLKAVPENSGMAYILVQHLDPAHESILADLLQRVTRIPIQEITDNIKVEPDHIYIIPSNKLLTATDGVLQLSSRPPKNQRNMPIDLFFRSLAEVHQNHAIGVVLSGTGTDGTIGLRAIKDNGGITFAQEQQSAAYEAMPQSAIDADVVDFVLTPEQISQQLLVLNEPLKILASNLEENAEQLQEDGYKQIISQMRLRKGMDFTYYKQSTIRRRIVRRVALSMKGSIGEYLTYLNENKSEQDILFNDLLIPVTQFFRDPKIFEQLNEMVFPALFKGRAGNEPLRFWIAGCSTGEEAYSILMCLHEYLGTDKASAYKIQVFATDISDLAIAKARTGTYTKKDVNELSASRLQQFFTKTSGSFQINKIIRDSCVFACHNFLKDPPFARIDLISCRNALIYLEPVLQKKALTTFHYALKEKGFLMLGKSETAAQAPDLFNPFDKNCKIYSRKQTKGRFLHFVAGHKDEFFKAGNLETGRKENYKDDFQKNADDILLSKYVPPGVIVNNEMDIVQFRGATGLWLEPASGKPNLNVLKMAREGLAFELRNALHKVKISGKALVKEGIPIQFMGGERLVTIEIIPLLNTAEPYNLILFRDNSISVDTNPDQTDKNRQIPDLIQNPEQVRIQELQRELAQSREDMRRITEDQEASNEELQSSNEELLSGSEELQSLNEELETSKEEIQTSNEELIVVNQELFDRNEQLNLSRLFAESIVTTIREPLIILNKNLQVKSANRSFYEKFQTSETATVGKLLFDLGNKQWDIPALRKMLEKILPEQTSIADFEVKHNFPALGERIMILNACQIFRDVIEEQSILVAIEDVTEKRNADKEFKLLTEELEKKVSERTTSLYEANIDLLHSNKNLEQFAYVASHDLQEPLRKIRTFSSLLQGRYDHDLPEPAKELILKITLSAERMSTLIKEVLNFSKILHGEANFEETDLSVIFRKITDDFDLLISEKRAVVQCGQLPVIEAIPLQINQLFYNLLSNSLKFSHKDIPPVITISSKNLTPKDLEKHKDLSKNTSYCEISFKDNGIGFDQKYAEQIFLIFHRLHAREYFTGTGIGLALCKTIVVNHNGDIHGISKKNEGALFQIILPLKQVKSGGLDKP